MASVHVSRLLALLIVVIQLWTSSGLAAHRPRRHKRTILQMCALIEGHTRRGCLDYNSYGCYCGYGNSGDHEPLDEVDRCCHEHDNCYGDVTCMWFYPQLVGYTVSCAARDSCTCQDNRTWSPCARSVCECDLRFAQCLQNAVYNNVYRRYPWRLCGASNNSN